MNGLFGNLWLFGCAFAGAIRSSLKLGKKQLFVVCGVLRVGESDAFAACGLFVGIVLVCVA